MRISELTHIIGVRPVITINKKEEGGNVVTFRYSRAEVKTDNGLISPLGTGGSIREAKVDYAERIKGQTLVLHAYTPSQREYYIPMTLRGY